MTPRRSAAHTTSRSLVPSATAIADDLWKVARSGVPNIDVESDTLRVLRALSVVLPADAEPPASRADLQRAIRLAIRSAPDPLTSQCLDALLDGTAPLEKRLAALGRLMAPRRGAERISAKTVRNSGRAKALVEDLATIIRDQEIRLRMDGARPAGEDIPAARVGPRAACAIYEEERLGYRWLSYERTLSGPNKDWIWDDKTTITIQTLRPTTRVELPITTPDADYADKITLDIGHYGDDGRLFWVGGNPPSTVRPISYERHLRTNTDDWRGVASFPVGGSTTIDIGNTVDLVFTRRTPSAFETEAARFPEARPNPHRSAPPSQWISARLEIAVLFDTVTTLTHEIQATRHPIRYNSWSAQEVHLVGDVQVHHAYVPLDIDLLESQPPDQAGHPANRVAYTVPNPMAGTVYSLEVDVSRTTQE